MYGLNSEEFKGFSNSINVFLYLLFFILIFVILISYLIFALL